MRWKCYLYSVCVQLGKTSFYYLGTLYKYRFLKCLPVVTILSFVTKYLAGLTVGSHHASLATLPRVILFLQGGGLNRRQVG